MESRLRFLVFISAICYVTNAYQMDMCKKPPAMKNFEFSKITGRWYEFARYPNILQILDNLRCMTHDVSFVNNSTQSLLTSYTNLNTGQRNHISGELRYSPERPGQMNVDLSNLFGDYFTVVDAKYDEYLVVYFCQTVGYFRLEFAWVYTRDPVLSKEKQESLTQKLASLSIDVDRLEYDENQQCKYD